MKEMLFAWIDERQDEWFDMACRIFDRPEVAGENLHQLGVPVSNELLRDSGGSTDFGNVSVIVPGALVYLPYCTAGAHSQEWVDTGKTEAAKECLLASAKVMAGMMYDLICDPELVKKAKVEWKQTG